VVLPALPDAHAGAVLLLTLVALALFTRERIPLESSSLGVLVLLAGGFALFPYTSRDGSRVEATSFFHGFGHEALVAVCALMVAGQGLVRTGALEPVGRVLGRLWAVRPRLSLLLTLVVGALLSAFVNNTPIVVLLLPILIGVSLRGRTSASGVLMPMGFATLIGGMTTTIGTSTNLLVVAVAADLGLPRMHMFDFFLPAAAAGGVGILYLWLLAPRLLPAREPVLPDVSPRVFAAQILVTETSPYAGRTLSDAVKATDGALKVARIQRGEHHMVPLPDVVLRPGDRLIVNDTPQRLKSFEQALQATLHTGSAPVDEEHPLTADDQQLAEIVVVQGSPLENRTLRRVRFIERYQLVVLALHRAGRPLEKLSARVSEVVLHVGDVLLVQGPREQIAAIRRDNELLVLDATTDLPHTRHAPVALAIMALVVGVATAGLLPIAVSALAGAFAMIASGCLSWRDAVRALSTPVVMIVVTSLALGHALLATGASEWITQVFLALAGGASPRVLLAGLMLLMAVLTNIVSNNAAAVIGTPIAVGIAEQLGLPPQPFVLAVLFGANMSYATPMAYKTNLLVMTAGGYTFSDFLRIGVPLTLIMWAALALLLPAMYGL
jgi:di/tricarboxylate transporter